MIAPGDLLTSTAQRPLPLRMRSDLNVSRQTHLGRNYWVIKDPLTLRFYRFEDEEYAILQMLDGKTSLADIQTRFEQQFPPQRLSLSQLQAFLAHLFQHALVVSDAPGQGDQLHLRGQRRKSDVTRAALGNILSIRFPGIDPDRLLSWLNRHLGWVFSGPAVFGSLLLVSAALLLVGVHFDTFMRRLPGFQEFFAADNWLLLAVVLGGTKVLHELGHGLACKRFGGQCHEMGLMFLVLTPCLYCDVSDSWMLSSKWRRAAIGAAGMYVELILAAICTFLWWFTDVGLLHYLCLNVMFVCSVSAILFNANPLLRYDGYYILSDLAEIPNLRQKATAIIQRGAAHWLLGLPPAADPFLPKRRTWLFAIYSVAAVIYRWIVVFSILWFLYGVFEPHGLKRIGQALVALAMYGLLIEPLWRLIRFLSAPGRMEEVKKLRLMFSIGVMGAITSAILLTPFPYSIPCEFQLHPRGATSVYVDVPGVVQDVHVRAGQAVQAGQALVTLENVDLKLLVVRLQGDGRQLEARLQSLQMRAYTDKNALLEMAQVRESLNALNQRIARRHEDLQRLTITAPRDGIILVAADVASRPSPGQLATWSGHPLEQTNVGAFLSEGTTICQIGDPNQLEAILAIDQSVIQFVRAGQHADLFPKSLLGDRLHGRIERISNTEMPLTQAALHGGGRSQQPTGRAPSHRHLPSIRYQASIPVQTTGQPVLPGVHGRARIDAGYRSLGRRAWDTIRSTFHFEL